LIQFCKKLDGEQIKSLEDSTFLNTEIIDKLPAWSHLDDEKITNPPLDHGETKDESYFIEESAPIPVIRIPTKHPVILEKNAMGKSQNNENEIA
jgi:hypothetical protein